MRGPLVTSNSSSPSSRQRIRTISSTSCAGWSASLFDVRRPCPSAGGGNPFFAEGVDPLPGRSIYLSFGESCWLPARFFRRLSDVRRRPCRPRDRRASLDRLAPRRSPTSCTRRDHRQGVFSPRSCKRRPACPPPAENLRRPDPALFRRESSRRAAGQGRPGLWLSVIPLDPGRCLIPTQLRSRRTSGTRRCGAGDRGQF